MIEKFLVTMKEFVRRKVTYLLSFWRRRKLVNRSFTIISNNCWGGFIYQRYNLPYKSPFLGLFIPAPCYIDLLENLKTYMNMPLRFIPIKQSKYYSRIDTGKRIYPIGVLGENIEIHFLHYKTPQEAKDKWEQRKQRIDLNNMLVKFSEIDCCTAELVYRFDKLPFKNKICFAVNSYPTLSSLIAYPHKAGTQEATGDYKYIPANLVDILNGLIGK